MRGSPVDKLMLGMLSPFQNEVLVCSTTREYIFMGMCQGEFFILRKFWCHRDAGDDQGETEKTT